MSDVEFGYKVEQVDFLYFGVVGKMIEEFVDVWWAGNDLLNDFAKGLKDGGIIDGGKVELNFFNIDLILTYFFLESEIILISCIWLIEINICFVGEDEDGAVVGVLLLDVIVDIVEIIYCLHDIWLRAYNVN